MDRRFGRSGKHCLIQSRVPVSADGGGRVVQVRVGGTRQVQDGEGRDGSLRKDFEMEWWTPTNWKRRTTPYIYSGCFIVKLHGTQNTEHLIHMHFFDHDSMTRGRHLVQKW